MEDKDKIEEILKQYPILKSKLIMKGVNTQKLEIPLSAISYKKAKAQKSNEFYSRIEDYIVDTEDIEQEIKDLFKVVKSVETALDCLPKDKYKIVKLIYFEEMNYLDVSFEMKISEKSVRNYRDDALEKLKKTDLPQIYRKFTAFLPEMT
ncbi:MAG: RNA polymerase sigma factor [bacterium]